MPLALVLVDGLKQCPLLEMAVLVDDKGLPLISILVSYSLTYDVWLLLASLFSGSV